LRDFEPPSLRQRFHFGQVPCVHPNVGPPHVCILDSYLGTGSHFPATLEGSGGGAIGLLANRQSRDLRCVSLSGCPANILGNQKAEQAGASQAHRAGDFGKSRHISRHTIKACERPF
jgi:hypothetical protein